MSTPRTDAIECGYESGNDWTEYRVMLKHARQLETELAARDDLLWEWKNGLLRSDCPYMRIPSIHCVRRESCDCNIKRTVERIDALTKERP